MFLLAEQADSLLSEPPGKPSNTGVGSLFLLQRIFPTQELNQGLLHCRWILYQLIYQGSPLKQLLVFHCVIKGLPCCLSGKESTAMLEIWVQSLGQENPLEKEMVTHSSTLAWKNPMDGEAWQATVHRVAKSWTRLSNFIFTFTFEFKSLF